MAKPRQSTCPNGHRPPRVQFLKDEGIYVCLPCAITWRQVLSVPAEDAESLKRTAGELGIKVATRGQLRDGGGGRE